MHFLYVPNFLQWLLYLYESNKRLLLHHQLHKHGYSWSEHKWDLFQRTSTLISTKSLSRRREIFHQQVGWELLQGTGKSLDSEVIPLPTNNWTQQLDTTGTAPWNEENWGGWYPPNVQTLSGAQSCDWILCVGERRWGGVTCWVRNVASCLAACGQLELKECESLAYPSRHPLNLAWCDMVSAQ